MIPKFLSMTEHFSNKFWSIEHHPNNERLVSMKLISDDLEGGFPGRIEVIVTYELTDDNQLIINYTAQSNKATPINLTNHCYFNLGESDCKSLKIQISASNYLELNANTIPTGNILPVIDTAYDFGEPKSINEQQALFANNAGYDLCYVIEKAEADHAKIISEENKVAMVLSTDQPGLQFYSGMFLGDEFMPYQGLCLEAQNFPDAINHQHFPSSVLEPGEIYQRTISYQFISIN